jgi:hypothetical protein
MVDEEANQDASEDFPKRIALALGIAYAVGLITTNVFLYGYGISDFSLVRPKALFTGTAVIGSLTLISFWPTRMAARIIESGPSRNLKSVTIAVAKSLVSWILLVPVCWKVLALGNKFQLAPIFEPWGVRQYTQPISIATQLFVAACTVSILAIQVVRIYGVAASSQTFASIARDWAKLAIFSAMLVGAFAWYVAVFSKYIYVAIPNQFGGGRPDEIRLVIKSDAEESVSSLGIRFVGNSRVTEPLTVLHDSSDSISVYVLFLANQKTMPGSLITFEPIPTAITVDKKAIDASIVDFPGLEDAIEHPESRRNWPYKYFK